MSPPTNVPPMPMSSEDWVALGYPPPPAFVFTIDLAAPSAWTSGLVHWEDGTTSQFVYDAPKKPAR